MARRKTHDEFVAEVKTRWGDKYEILGEYINNRTRLLVKYKECSHTKMVAPPILLKGCDCLICSNEKNGEHRRTTRDEFKKKVFDLVGSEYSLVGEYTKSSSKAEMRHNICSHTWMALPSDFLRGSRCPLCAGSIKKTTEQFKMEVLESVGGEYTVLDNYTNNRVKVEMRHNTCGRSWKISPREFLCGGNRCPFCTKSRGEDSISKYLTNNKIDYDTEFCINRRVKTSKRFDFRVGNLLIEMDGYQHFKKAHGVWAKKKTLEDQKENDKYKTESALLNGYKLVRISYSELKNIDKILDFVFNNEMEDLNLFGVEYNERYY